VTFGAGDPGGVCFSPDGRRLAFHADPQRRGQPQIFTVGVDGRGLAQVTANGAANRFPVYHPVSGRIVFTSWLHGRDNPQVYACDPDGSDMLRVTWSPGQDSQPALSADGGRILWTSSRGGAPQIWMAEFADPLAAFAAEETAAANIVARDLRRHVDYLASDALEGRLAGSPGAEKAAEWIAREFAAAGLAPRGGAGFRHEFQAVAGVEPGRGMKMAAGAREFIHGKEWQAFAVSPSASVAAGAAFVGYGLTDADYAGLDVRGRIVFCLRGAPSGGNVRRASLMDKTAGAARRGAAAVVFVTGSRAAEGAEPLAFDCCGWLYRAPVPMAHLARAAAEELFAAHGRDLAVLQKSIDESGASASFDFPAAARFAFTADLRSVKVKTANIIGVIEGRDPVLKDEFIVIGAHYDHVGVGAPTGDGWRGGAIGHPRMKGEDAVDRIYNGADDNASGTAVLLALARSLSAERGRLRRSVVFAAFSGEEVGLLGSAEYALRPAAPLERTAAMIDIDMVGRMRANRLYVEGAGTAREFPALLGRADALFDLRMALSASSRGTSDQAPFDARGVPTLFFWTGVHERYHQVDDEADTLDYPDLERIARFIHLLARDMAESPEPPKRAEPSAPPPSGPWRSHIGVVPDWTSAGEGLRVAGVAAGQAAETAGLRAGDIVLRLNGEAVEGPYDLMQVLSACAPGTSVKAIVKRGEKDIEIDIRMPGGGAE
jgi:aminopeptidase YwaD